MKKAIPAFLLVAAAAAVLSGAASYPSAVKSFTTRVAGDTIAPSHINDLQDEVTAIETDLLKAWSTQAYSAGDYTASAGTWTVESGETTLAYHKIGKRMTVTFEILTSDVSSTPLTLRITIPGGFTAAKATHVPILVSDAAAAFAIGIAEVDASGTTIKCYVDSTLVNTWSTTSSDNTYVRGQITIETTT